jgi:plasmid maintenance system antidote protein VapI
VENNGLKFVKKINEYGKAGISTDLALRLASWLDGPTAESWLKGQLAYDLRQAEPHRPTISIRHAQVA